MYGQSRHTRKRRRQLGSVERDILNELSLGDLAYGFLLSGRSTKRLFKLARERANSRYRRKLAIERLQDLEFIIARGEKLSITSAGRGALGDQITKTLRLLDKEIWDYKWRIVAFDIPEKYASLRFKVRTILKKAGFVKLQQSIWVFPHECRELAELIKQESQLSKYILYGVLEHIDGEARLRKLFNV